MVMIRDKGSYGLIQGFAPTEAVEVNDGQTIEFEHGSVFMNEEAASFAINGGVGFFLQANMILVAAKENISFTPQGKGARFLVTGEYSIS